MPLERLDILLIDDDPAIRILLSDAFTRSGYAFICVGSGNSAREALKRYAFRLVVTDLLMPDGDGIEVIMRHGKQHPDTVFLAMSGGGRAGSAEDLLRSAKWLGCSRTITKPFELAEFLSAVANLLHASRFPAGRS